MRFLTLYWWEWVAYAFGFSSIIINGWWLLTISRESSIQIGGTKSIGNLPSLEESANSTQFLPQVKAKGKVTVWIGLPLLSVIMMMTGYLIRDHQLATSIVVYSDVAIKPPSKPNTDFDLQPARMQPISSKLCSYTVDWKYGEILKDLTFEQRKGCKRIIAYHRYAEREKYVSIQMR